MVESKLFKTRPCQMYHRGGCARPYCNFAHTSAELRRTFDGREEHSGGRDLRERLDRMPKSPVRRDHEARHYSRGDSPCSLGKRFDRNPLKRMQLNDHTDYSGRMSNRTEDQTNDRRQTSSDTKIRINEQLREMHYEIKKLESDKRQLELYLVDKATEADTLTLKVHELEKQLSKENEQAERYTAKIKKFIKAHKRHMQLQDELKRSHAQLQKLGEQLDPDVTGPDIEDDLRINTIIDEKIGGFSQDEGQINYYPPRKKRSQVLLEAHVDNQVNPVGETEIEKNGVEKRSRKSRSRNRLSKSKKPEADVDVCNERGLMVYEGKSRRGIIDQSYDIASADKGKVSEAGLIMPSTGIAVHACDEEVEVGGVDDKVPIVGAETAVKFSRLPFLPPPLPPIPPNVYLQYKGDDKNVDVVGVDGRVEVNID